MSKIQRIAIALSAPRRPSGFKDEDRPVSHLPFEIPITDQFAQA